MSSDLIRENRGKLEGDTFGREICSSHEAAEWQAAMETLILVATSGAGGRCLRGLAS